MHPIFDLFEDVCTKESGEDYGQVEVKRAAKPYIDYLRRVQEWNKDRSVLWKVKRPGKNGGAKAGSAQNRHRSRDKPGRRKGVPISLDEADHADPSSIVGEAKLIGHVYECDPGKGSKVNTSDKIDILSVDEDELLIWLERDPTKPCLKVERSTYQTAMMIKAMEGMLYRPRPDHMPLRRLFRRKSGSAWPHFEESEVDRWFFLRDDVDGVDEQKRFVRTALGTPDFAFLDGPPGSGKTAALCELAVQMAARGKRVLFCASTHVAVDNLLERIAEKGGDAERHVVPIRMGKSEKVSEAAFRYEYDQFVSTVGNKVRSRLSGLKSRSKAQEMMLATLNRGDKGEALGKLTRDHANLVCGTNMGILRHPDIWSGTLRRFDMMILDEASKTTLQEFLVPAVHADKWVIVGDKRQLVPYTDQRDMAVHVDACIEPALGKLCLDVFMAKKHRQQIVLADLDQTTEQAYRVQCEKLDVGVRRAVDGAPSAGKGDVVIGKAEAANPAPRRPGAEQRGAAKGASNLRRGRDGQTWAEEVAWRIGIHWHGIMGDTAAGGSASTLKDETDMLMPACDGAGEVRQRIDLVKRIAVPSVLEVIEDGFPGGHDDDCDDTLLEHGMPGDDFGRRHVLLKWQHRMHPDIAAFSRQHVYEGRALGTPNSMTGKRAWQYGRYSNRVVWIDVRGSGADGTGSMSNEEEARCIVDEVKAFAKFAKRNRRPDGGPWEVAVLPFYTGQRNLLERHMCRLDPQGGPHTFRLPSDNLSVLVKLHTVDSFQGHEADLVLLGLTNSHPTLFLANPNRLNVALTRARYQCVIFGDKAAMSKKPILKALANEIPHWTGVR